MTSLKLEEYHSHLKNSCGKKKHTKINRYGLTFERVWYAGSKAVMDSVLSGVTDTTEPYMMVGAQYVVTHSI